MTAVSRQSGFVLDAVTVRYNAVTALNGVSLTVGPGEAVGFIGPSGAGKTTLLRLFNGTVRPSSGRVVVNGRDLTSLSPRQLRQVRAQIGVVHQDLSLIPSLRVIQNVMLGRLGSQSFVHTLRGLLWAMNGEAEAVHRLLDRVGIEDKLYQRTDRLSGGQRQRVAIARALYQQPTALLADEPVSSVDPARAHDTVALLAGISREQGLTLCMSLHRLDLAQSFFPRLVGLREGRVAFDLPTRQVTEEQINDLYELSPRADPPVDAAREVQSTPAPLRPA